MDHAFLQKAGAKDRAEDRTSAMLRARLRGTGAEREISIHDMSSRGLLASTPNRRNAASLSNLSLAATGWPGRSNGWPETVLAYR